MTMRGNDDDNDVDNDTDKQGRLSMWVHFVKLC